MEAPNRRRRPCTRAGAWMGIAVMVTALAGCGADDTLLVDVPEAEGLVVEYELIGADGNGDLWVIDAATGGLLTLWLDTDDGGSNLGVISAAVPVFSESDVNPAAGTAIGTLYVGTGGPTGAPNCNGCIYTIDTATGAATLRTNATPVSNTYRNVSSMTLQSDGTILLTASDDLYSLDPATDDMTLIGTPPCCGFGMTFDLSGTLYEGGGSNLYELDPTNGSSTLVAAFSYSGFSPSSPKMVAMTTHPETGQVLGVLNDGSGGGGPRYLVDVNVATAEMTLIGQTDDRLDGLTYIPFDVTDEQ